MKQYEYKVVLLKIPTTFSENKMYKSIEIQINEYGKQGWELCSVDKHLAYLKRELTTEKNLNDDLYL